MIWTAYGTMIAGSQAEMFVLGRSKSFVVYVGEPDCLSHRSYGHVGQIAHTSLAFSAYLI